MNFSSTDWEQCIEEKAGKTDQNGIELVNTTSRNGRMEIWLFNIGRSAPAYLRSVPVSSGKNHHTSLPAYPEHKTFGIAGKSPEGNEDLQQIARPKRNALEICLA
ncbi:hypothetical protein [Parabacteroides distasonis]|uniref:hypothetical protein n=1 Tax=Parabacteroides distasonis TaxID=823 RepID=UPI001F1D9053|nr:hypothetical protein [Parabacteroides distasonis]MCE9061279.1 hypothetical protein [Parabacteroides distasonis]